MLTKPFATIIILTLMLVALTNIASGKVYSNKEEALRRAFPDAETIETINLYLSEQEIEKVARASGVKPDSALYSFYVGKKNNKVTGYAAIEAATVRTLPETVIVVLQPDGSVRHTEILAFFEPEEYKPPKRWLDQFPGKKLSSQLRIGGEIQGITGATLSAQAITRQVRKTAAILRILIGKNNK